MFKEQEVSNASPDWRASRVIWCALFHVVNRYVGYLLPMPGVFRDYPAPVIRNTQDGTEITLMRWAANLCAVAAARLAGMQAERVSQTLRRCDGASADVLTFPRTAKWARQPTLRF